MSNIESYHKANWKDIISYGDIVDITAVDSGDVVITYVELTDIGEVFINNINLSYKDTTNNVLKEIGFNVDWKDLSPEILGLCRNVYDLDIIELEEFPRIHELHTILQRFEPVHDDYIVDTESNSIYINQHEPGVIFGPDLSEDGLSDFMDSFLYVYEYQCNILRTHWFKLLQTATYVEDVSGNMFKLPDGVVIKIDDGDVPLHGEYRIYCQILENSEIIEICIYEGDFLSWLFKYLNLSIFKH